MGRCVTGDFEHKFWVAVQPSSDIQEFGGVGIDTHEWFWGKQDLPYIKSKLSGLENRFRKSFGIACDEFMNRIREKGYTCTNMDKETMTERWQSMLELASKIELGRKISDTVKEKGQVQVVYEC